MSSTLEADGVAGGGRGAGSGTGDDARQGWPTHRQRSRPTTNEAGTTQRKAPRGSVPGRAHETTGHVPGSSDAATQTRRFNAHVPRAEAGGPQTHDSQGNVPTVADAATQVHTLMAACLRLQGVHHS